MKPLMDLFDAMEPDSPVLRFDKEGKTDNHIWHWDVGDKDKTDSVFRNADVVVKQQMYIPRIHVASIETCGCVASYDKVDNHLAMYMTTQAPHAIERMTDMFAQKVGKDPAQLRMKSFIKKEEFPWTSPTGWLYDSGDYHAGLKLAMDTVGYDELRKEQLKLRKEGKLMGIGIPTFTEVVGAGPSKDFDILGIKMFDSVEIRVHPTGKAIARFGTKPQGQGHETTYAQIIAEELGIPMEHIQIEEGDTDTAP